MLCVILATSSVSVGAFEQKVYSASDISFTSTLCAIAGNEGKAAAKRYARQSGMDFKWLAKTIECNGIPIRALAADAERSARQDKREQVVLIATVNDTETRWCIDATKMSPNDPKLKSMPFANLACNGKPVTQFVKEVWIRAK